MVIKGTLEAINGLTLARISAATGITAADDRGVYLDIAAAAPICGALFQPVVGARGAAAPITLAAPSAVCAVPACAGQSDRCIRAPSGDRERAHRPDHRHS